MSLHSEWVHLWVHSGSGTCRGIVVGFERAGRTAAQWSVWLFCRCPYCAQGQRSSEMASPVRPDIREADAPGWVVSVETRGYPTGGVRVERLRSRAARVSGGYNIAVGERQRRPDGHETRAYNRSVVAAGATWWVEDLPPGVGRVEAARACVARDPLQVACARLVYVPFRVQAGAARWSQLRSMKGRRS